MVKTKKFNLAEYIKTEQDTLDFLSAAAQDPDPKVFIAALSAAVRIRGMTAVAREAGVNRESLYMTFSANPRYETIVKLTRALGCSLSVVPLPPGSQPR